MVSTELSSRWEWSLNFHFHSSTQSSLPHAPIVCKVNVLLMNCDTIKWHPSIQSVFPHPFSAFRRQSIRLPLLSLMIDECLDRSNDQSFPCTNGRKAWRVNVSISTSTPSWRNMCCGDGIRGEGMRKWAGGERNYDIKFAVAICVKKDTTVTFHIKRRQKTVCI